MNSHNGTTPGASSMDEDIDLLYSWWPGTPPTAPACPEALFSLTLRGKLDGIETLLTVRGMTPEAFQRNLQAVRGLLDAPPVPAATQGAGWCQQHGVQMQQTTKQGRSWFSHKTTDGWCKGR
jgi:hypothetical protein